MLARPLQRRVVGPLALALSVTACSRSSSVQSQTSVTSADAEARAEAQQRLEDAAAVLAKVRSELPAKVATRARCVAVVPGMLKGGFVVGARSGKGFATCRTATGTWSAPAPISVSGGSFGAQIGVASLDVVMVITSDRGMRSLERAKLALGGDVSVAAGPVGKGKGRAAETDPALEAEVLSYSFARGLFAGAELNGAVIEQDAATTAALYGTPKPPELRTLVEGEVPPPPAAQHFLEAVRETFPPATASR
jgi:lipid-binding SYLF domain-containing protein